MNILLINSPVRLDAEPNCIPYGLAIIASVLRHSGHDVDLYDINGLRHGRDRVLAELTGKTWDVAGVSGLITTFSFQEWLIPALKKIHPHGVVVSGGGLATSNPDLLFRQTPVDIAVQGEGEKTFPGVLEALKTHGDLGRVPGLACRRGHEIHMNPPVENVSCLDDLPLPAWDLLPMDIYLANPIWGNTANNSSGFREDVRTSRSMNIISSRGCPFSCNYCYHLFGRSTYRFRSVAGIIHEIELLIHRYGTDFIGFVDDNMMADQDRLMAFCREMKQRKLPVTWGCHGRVSSAHPQVLSAMAEAGCVWIGYGIESGSPAILRAMNKKASVQQAEAAIVQTRQAGIYPNTTFIFGYPGESLKTIQETVDFKRKLGLNCGSFFATPYPGTPLYRQIRPMIPDEETFIRSLGNATEFSINLTDFSTPDLFELKRKMDANIDVI